MAIENIAIEDGYARELYEALKADEAAPIDASKFSPQSDTAISGVVIALQSESIERLFAGTLTAADRADIREALLIALGAS